MPSVVEINTKQKHTEVNEKTSVSLALIWWQNHDARQIVLLLAVFLLQCFKTI